MRTLTLLVLLLALGACNSGPQPIWAEDEFEVRSERMLWDVLRLALDRADYAVGSGAEPEARKIESAWEVDASPFKGQGYRRKAHVEYAPTPGRAGVWDVRVRVEKETNESFKGLDLRYADWKPAVDDGAAATRIMQFTRSLLGGGQFELGPTRPGASEPRTLPRTVPRSEP